MLSHENGWASTEYKYQLLDNNLCITWHQAKKKNPWYYLSLTCIMKKAACAVFRLPCSVFWWTQIVKRPTT